MTESVSPPPELTPSNPQPEQQPAKQPNQQNQLSDQKKPTSGLGISALVLGIIAVVSCWIPIINNISALIAVIGLVLGIIAIYRARAKGPTGGRGIAIAGTVLCAIAIIVTLIVQASFSKAIDDAVNESNKPAASAPAKSGDAGKDAAKSDAAKQGETTVAAGGSVTIGNYSISNVSVKKDGKDVNGKPAAIVTYDLAYNGKEKSNPLDLHVQLFQEGVELERAIFMDQPAGYDPESAMKTLMPGGKLKVTEAFVLKSETAPVTLSIEETISFDKNATKVKQEFPIK